jgi:putative glutamine amidotransferase
MSRPIIGCTTYRKSVPQKNPIDVYGLVPSYTEAVTAAGGIPVLIPLGLGEADLQTIFNRIDGLILPGGGDVEPRIYNGQSHETLRDIDPERDRTEIIMARLAIENRKPILAICRGLQVLNIALGGTLWEDISSLVPGTIDHESLNGHPRNHLAHTVSVNPKSSLARHLGRTKSWVNSYHHQAIRDLATGLTTIATSSDGVIEAVEMTEHPYAIGVQWHPENLVKDDPAMLSLFRGLVKEATQESITR